MFKKLLITFSLLFFLATIISPILVLAEGSVDSKTPELNPLCWQKSKCEAVRKDYFGIKDSKNPDSWCVKESPCNGKVSGSENDYWCKCLPGGQTNTAIKIGGIKTFSHLGVYLLTVYDYALKIAGIVAVLVIIVAGVQWMTSGGNGSIIEASKKRILGAFVGLFIAYGSFFILNTINPALVNLRLPQTWMLKPQTMMAEFCSALPEDTMFALAAKADNQKSPVTGPKTGEKYQYNYKDAKAKDKLEWFECGKRFVSKDGGSASCWGNYCKKGQFCANFDTSNPKTIKYECKKGTIGGTITYKTIGSQWDADEITNEDENELWIVCRNLVTKEISSKTDTKSKTGYQSYVMTVSSGDVDKAVKDFCKGKKEVLGFAVKMEFNYAKGLFGSFNDDNIYIGAGGQQIGYRGYGTARDNINEYDNPEVCKKTACFLQRWNNDTKIGRVSGNVIGKLIPPKSIIENQAYTMPNIDASNIKTISHWIFSP